MKVPAGVAISAEINDATQIAIMKNARLQIEVGKQVREWVCLHRDDWYVY